MKTGRQVKGENPSRRRQQKSGTRPGSLRTTLVNRRNVLLKEAKEEIAKYISGDTRQMVDTALDEGDFAAINVAEDVNLGRLTIYRNALRDIDVALRKIDEGGYGFCEECGAEIPEKRLEAVPTARFCIDCQEKNERIERLEAKVPEG